MTFFLNSAIQVSLIVLAAFLWLPLLRGKSAALRHCVLSTAIVFSMLVPAFNLAMPLWNVGAAVSRYPALTPIRERLSALSLPSARAQAPLESTRDAGSVAALPGRVPQPDRLPASELTAGLWMAGSLTGLVVFITGLVRIRRVASASMPIPDGVWRRLAASISSEYGLRSFVRLLESRNPSILVTWGVFRPKVVLPSGSADWPQERARIVLRHELAHIRRGDWIVQMIAQTLRIVYWFNPLVWIACRRLRLESECACDDAVLSSDLQGHEYASHLLDLARVLNRTGQSWSAALTMARPSTIERRFSAMLNPQINRRPVTRYALLTTVVAGLGLSMSLSAVSTPVPMPLAPASATPAVMQATAGAVNVALRPIAMVAPRVAQAPAATPNPNQLLNLNEIQDTLNSVVHEVERLVNNIRMGPATAGTTRPARKFFPSRNQILPQNQAAPAGAQNRLRSSALDRSLIEVAGDGDLNDILELLRAGANVNAVVDGDGTPLMAAADDGHIEAVRLLLDRGADPNIAAAGDGNALIVAAGEGHYEVVRLLLDRGADPNAAVPGDGNPLIAAAREGHANVVTLLLDRGANVDQVVPGDENPLIQASSEGHLNVVQLLVSRKADVNVRVFVEANPWRPNGEWRSPLSEARKGGHQAIVQFLLSAGARE